MSPRRSCLWPPLSRLPRAAPATTRSRVSGRSPRAGRRIEITKDDEQYRLLYGAALRPYPATRDGDELRIRQPIGDDIVVRVAFGGRLQMVIGGKTTRLVRVPQHQ